MPAHSAPPWDPSTPLRVMTWNVQFFAGAGYVFFYDLPGWSGPDRRPSPVACARSLRQVAAVIEEEAPDAVLLQELDDGAARTDLADQLRQLQSELRSPFPVALSTFYWRARFVPHPKVMGPVGLKLAILSRFQLRSARRHQLPRMPGSPVHQALNFHRAILEARVATTASPSCPKGEVALLCTHLDAFAQGSDTMQRQVAKVGAVLSELDRERVPWVIGGDFNLLGSDSAYGRLMPHDEPMYQPTTELAQLTRQYRSHPSPADLDGPDETRYRTYIPNDPRADGPDRTIDYLFMSERWQLSTRSVRQDSVAMSASDHLPVIATLSLEARNPAA